MNSTPSQEQIDAFVAACHGDLATVQSTLAGHPELVNTRSSLDESPLGAAAHVGNQEIAEYLLSQGAEMEIGAAAMLGDVDSLRTFLEQDPDLAQATGAHGIPVLFHASAGGSVEAVELLLENGADLVTVTGPESTALNMAAARGHLAMARWLIDRGAPADVADFQGKTPIERAEEGGFEEIAGMIRDTHRIPEDTA